MRESLNKSQIERFSRQLVLKNIGAKGQKKILSSKILIVGVGGLGCPAAENLVRAGIGTIGLVDNDIVNLSNIHRQSLFTSKDIKKSKVSVAAKKLRDINPSTKIKTYKSRLNKNNIKNIIKDYEIIIDGSDNFKTKFLINEYHKISFKKIIEPLFLFKIHLIQKKIKSSKIENIVDEKKFLKKSLHLQNSIYKKEFHKNILKRNLNKISELNMNVLENLKK